MFKCHGKSKQTVKLMPAKFGWNEFIKKCFN